MTSRYEWLKDGNQLNYSTGHIIKKEYGNIRIDNPVDDDEGDYQCFISNEYGSTMTDVSVVKSSKLPPFPSSAPNKISSANGLNMSIPCNYNTVTPAVPNPTLAWSTPPPSSNHGITLDKRVQMDDTGKTRRPVICSNCNFVIHLVLKTTARI